MLISKGQSPKRDPTDRGLGPLCFRGLSEAERGMLIVESEPVRRHWFEPSGERKNQAATFYRGQTG